MEIIITKNPHKKSPLLSLTKSKIKSLPRHLRLRVRFRLSQTQKKTTRPKKSQLRSINLARSRETQLKRPRNGRKLGKTTEITRDSTDSLGNTEERGGTMESEGTKTTTMARRGPTDPNMLKKRKAISRSSRKDKAQGLRMRRTGTSKRSISKDSKMKASV